MRKHRTNTTTENKREHADMLKVEGIAIPKDLYDEAVKIVEEAEEVLDASEAVFTMAETARWKSRRTRQMTALKRLQRPLKKSMKRLSPLKRFSAIRQNLPKQRRVSRRKRKRFLRQKRQTSRNRHR